MKTILIAIAACLACVTGYAQTATVGSTTNSTAGATNQGNNQQFNPTLMFNEAAATPFTSTEIRYSGSQSVKTVPNVVAPGLVATPATCLGSRSGGGSVLGFGGTAASTVPDDACNGREGAKLYHVMHMPEVAIERLCLVPDERKAIEAAFLKARRRWVDAATAAQGKGKPLPELQATPRCSADQDAEDEARTSAAFARAAGVSTSTQPGIATLATAGVLGRERGSSYASP